MKEYGGGVMFPRFLNLDPRWTFISGQFTSEKTVLGTCIQLQGNYAIALFVAILRPALLPP
jgi:hypothetical protein